MLRFIRGTPAADKDLLHSMYVDRATQFYERLKWDVKVNAEGEEKDEYDHKFPKYVIWQKEDGTHGGSMRMIPCNRETMVNQHFQNLLPYAITDPNVWECSRFCLSPTAERRVKPILVAAAGILMELEGFKKYIGVYDNAMKRIYKTMRVEPVDLGSSGEGRNKITAGLWKMETDAWEPTLEEAQITISEIKEAYHKRNWI